MRHASADDAVGHVAAGGDAQAAVVDEGAGAALGGVEFVGGRVEHHAGDRHAVAFKRHRDGEDRDRVQEVGRSVKRVDHPAVLLVLAGHLATLLHQEAVGGTHPLQLLEQRLLRALVGGRDEIAGAFHRHLQVLDLAEIAGKTASGLADGLDHDVEEGGTSHFGEILQEKRWLRSHHKRPPSASVGFVFLPQSPAGLRPLGFRSARRRLAPEVVVSPQSPAGLRPPPDHLRVAPTRK